MNRQAILLFVLTMFIPLSSYAQDSFSIAGELNFFQEEDVCIGLYTENEWANLKQPVMLHVIKLTGEQKSAGKVRFKIDGVPRGTYAILAGQDVNGNGKIDRDEEGHVLEPAGTYKPAAFSWNWHEVKFDLNQDISNIFVVLMRFRRQ